MTSARTEASSIALIALFVFIEFTSVATAQTPPPAQQPPAPPQQPPAPAPQPSTPPPPSTQVAGRVLTLEECLAIALQAQRRTSPLVVAAR